MSAFSMKTWLKKGYTEEEARYQIAIRRPTNIQYYLNKNMTQEQAEEALLAFQKRACAVAFQRPIEDRRKTNTTCIEYYLEKGYSEDQARELRKERQTVFSKEKCIDKHGEEQGLKIFTERQLKWQSTLNAKSQEEIDDMNRRKGEWWYNLTVEERQSRLSFLSSISSEWWNNISDEDLDRWKERSRKTRVQNGFETPLELLDDFVRYKKEVWRYTNRNDLTVLKDYDKRGRTGYHLDHRYSIFEGFKNNVDTAIVGHIKNLEMLHYSDNLSKHSDCSITLDELKRLISESTHDQD